MTIRLFYTDECFFYIVPGDTFLFNMPLRYLPVEGMLVEYTDVETSVTTVYRIQDVVLEVEEVAAVPPVIGPPRADGRPKTHVGGWRVEVEEE